MFKSLAIYRLRSWEAISSTSKTHLLEIESLLSSDNKYANLRKLISDASNVPLNSYTGIIQGDVTFIHEAPDNVGELINWNKQNYLAKTILEFEKQQRLSFNFHPIQGLISFLKNVHGVSEESLYSLSTELEPRVTSG